MIPAGVLLSQSIQYHQPFMMSALVSLSTFQKFCRQPSRGQRPPSQRRQSPVQRMSSCCRWLGWLGWPNWVNFKASIYHAWCDRMSIQWILNWHRIHKIWLLLDQPEQTTSHEKGPIGRAFLRPGEQTPKIPFLVLACDRLPIGASHHCYDNGMRRMCIRSPVLINISSW